MSKVYFIRAGKEDSPEVLGAKAAKVYERAGYASQFDEGKLVALKQHFGEHGGNGYLKPPIAKAFASLIGKSGGKPFLTDSCTLYKGHRSNAVDHLAQCLEHGFTHESVGCPIIMADGLRGESQVMVDVEGKHYKRVPIASVAYHAWSLVVLTHVTGHVGAGMGASLKNVAMGCVSRAGKLSQHHGDCPIVKVEACTACGACEKWCPVDAITVEKHALIDKTKCIGCGECLAICPFDALGFNWSDTPRQLGEKMAEHALAVKLTHPGRMCCFNFATHVTEGCDCFGIQQDAVCADFGIVASDDIVACDQATADLMRDTLGRDVFHDLYPNFDYLVQLAHGESIGLGSRKYELVEVQ